MPKQNNNNHYFKGIAWFIASILISNFNDVLMKHLSYNDVHPVQIAFLRFLFSAISLLPFMLYYGTASFKTSRPKLHIARGTLLFCAMSIWCFGLSIVPIISATLLTFTIPFFVLIMAPIFLNEKIRTSLWVATIIGFLGVFFVLEPEADDFNPFSMLMILSAFLFATLDIMNKKYIVKETMLNMLFYSALITSVLALGPAVYFWQAMVWEQYAIVIMLGICGNLILFCILKAFSYVKASDVSPYRYLELILSAGMGFFIFAEVPSYNTIIGALIIVPTTFFIAYTHTGDAKINKQARSNLNAK